MAKPTREVAERVVLNHEEILLRDKSDLLNPSMKQYASLTEDLRNTAQNLNKVINDSLVQKQPQQHIQQDNKRAPRI